MGWERRAKKPHTCQRPNTMQTSRRNAEAGDIWKCRKCGTRWELTYAGIPSANRAGPMHENQWRRRGTPDYEAVFGIPDDQAEYELPPTIADPPRQTGTDWLYSVAENDA